MPSVCYRRSILAGLLAAALALPLHPAPALSAERSEIPEKYKWDLTDLYEDAAAWETARARFADRISMISKYEGRLSESPGTLYDALTTMLDLNLEFDRVYVWTYMNFDTDTRVAKHQEYSQAAQKVAVDFGTATSFIRPELIGMGKAKVDQFVAAEPRLGAYRILLDNILRYEPHTLSPVEEKLVARAGTLDNSGDIYSILNDADMPYPSITLSTGETVKLDASGYSRYRQSPNRGDRKAVFQAFWKAHDDFKRTYGTTLHAQVKAHVFNKEVRKYDSSLQAALFGNNIPVEIYTRLLKDVNDNLPTLHRYLKLRQRMMGIPDLGYEDLYAPLVGDVSMTFTPEEAMQVTVDAVQILGPEYVATLKKAFDERWFDWMPSPGKRSGAYSTGVFGVHPYQLQSFNGTYSDVGTFAHEAGHTLHTYLSDTNQPYVTHDYPTFVAEVASTANENFLLHSMIGKSKDDDTRLYLLGNYLEDMRTTLFRQTMFAEFELAIHEKVEKGEPLSGENLNELYLGLARKYYGHDQGICTVDELYGVEWAYIAHFYYNFYVFQYATSMIASTSLASGILEEKALGEGKTAKRDAYMNLLKAGGSKFPVDLLRDAGVDMTTSAPFQDAMKEMNAVMDQMEAILAKR